VIVDAHTHAFPTVAWGHEWQRMLGVDDPRRSGQIDELSRRLAAGGIDHAVVLLNVRSGELAKELTATRDLSQSEIRDQVQAQILKLNRWGLELGAADGRFLPFVGVNVQFMNPDELVAEIDYGHTHGARGVKIIPPSMQVYADDPLLEPVVRRCAELRLPLLTQSGTGGGPPPEPGADSYGRPARWAPALRKYPSLTLILAHLGLGYEDDVVTLCTENRNVFTDTSLRLSRLGRPGQPSPTDIAQLIRRIGVDHVLFGTNYPFVDPAAYVERLQDLPLSDHEQTQVAGANFARLMGI
jgi:uncharacterized protein